MQAPTIDDSSQLGLKYKLIIDLLGPALALVGTLAPVLLSWAHDKNAATVRSLRLDEAGKRVAFWDSWLKASSGLNLGHDASIWIAKAKEQMLLVSAEVECMFTSRPSVAIERERATDFHTEIMSLPRWRRLFLIYQPASSRAWLPRFIFYIYTLYVPLVLPLLYYEHRKEFHHLDRQVQRDNGDTQMPQDDKLKHERSLENLRDRNQREFNETFPLEVMGSILFCIVFRQLSVVLEKPKSPS